MTAEDRPGLINRLKVIVRQEIMREVVLPMNNGGSEELKELRLINRERRLTPDEQRKHDDLMGNAKVLYLLAGNRFGRAFIDWLAK